jgi:tetratricopeptide (TPR) repeat protein
MISEQWPDPAAVKRRAAELAEKAELEAAKPIIEAAEKSGDAARKAGRNDEALAKYGEALRATTAGSEPEARIRKKAIAVVRAMDAPPDVPEEANRHLVRARAYLKGAGGPNVYESAVKELREVIGYAPWLPEAYYNLGLVQQRSGQPAAAISSFKLYLDASPGASDAKTVQDKIYELEVASEARGNK